jgi:hypothetical protein
MRQRWLLTAALLVVPASSFAQQAPASEAAIREAEQRFAEGKVLADRGKFAEARTKFAEACAAHHTSSCAKNLGATELELGLYPEATLHLGEFLREAPAADPTYAKVRSFFNEAYAKSGHLEVVAPAGADIFVDDLKVGRAPISEQVHVKAGLRNVKAVDPDGRSANAAVKASDGNVTRVSLQFELNSPKITPPPSVRSGLDDPPPRVDEPEKSHAARTWTLVFGAASLVALGVGTGFGLASNGKRSDAESLSGALPSGACATGSDPRCGSLSQARDAQASDATLSTVFFVGSGVLLGATAVAGILWLSGSSSSTEKPARAGVLPMVGPGVGGAQLRGFF